MFWVSCVFLLIFVQFHIVLKLIFVEINFQVNFRGKCNRFQKFRIQFQYQVTLKVELNFKCYLFMSNNWCMQSCKIPQKSTNQLLYKIYIVFQIKPFNQSQSNNRHILVSLYPLTCTLLNFIFSVKVWCVCKTNALFTIVIFPKFAIDFNQKLPSRLYPQLRLFQLRV